MVLALVCIIIGLVIAHWPYQYEPPPSVPTAPPPPPKRERPPRRPRWVAEIRTGKFKPPKRVVVEANTEAEAVMKLISSPLSFNPRDIGLLKPQR